MSTITKEWLQQKIADMEEHRDLSLAIWMMTTQAFCLLFVSRWHRSKRSLWRS